MPFLPEMLEIHAPRNSLEMEEEQQIDMEKVGSEANVAIMKQIEQEKEGFFNLPVSEIIVLVTIRNVVVSFPMQ